MKFSKEKLIKIIKEEYERVEKEAENAEKSPETASAQLAWMDKSMERIHNGIENEADFDPEMIEKLGTAANLLDHVADLIDFGKLVKQHIGGNPEEDDLNED